MVESWQWWMVGDPLHTFCLVQFQRRQSDRQTLVFAPPALIPCSFPYGINPRRGEEYTPHVYHTSPPTNRVAVRPGETGCAGGLSREGETCVSRGPKSVQA